jgi:hypothetical protein
MDAYAYVPRSCYELLICDAASMRNQAILELVVLHFWQVGDDNGRRRMS